MFQMGRNAAKANQCELLCITPYFQPKIVHPLLRRGYVFHFQVYDHTVQVEINLHDLANRKEHELIQIMSEVIRNDRIKQLTR